MCKFELTSKIERYEERYSLLMRVITLRADNGQADKLTRLTERAAYYSIKLNKLRSAKLELLELN